MASALSPLSFTAASPPSAAAALAPEGGARLMRQLVDAIKHLTPIQHAEIFKMLKQSGAMFTQNSNGVFCDLAAVDEQVVQDIGRFVTFWSSNKHELDEYEKRLCEAKMHTTARVVQQQETPCLEPHQSSTAASSNSATRVARSAAAASTAAAAASSSSSACAAAAVKKKCTSTRFMLAKKRFSKRSALGRAVADSVLEEELFPELEPVQPSAAA